MTKESYRAYLKSDSWKAKRQAIYQRALTNANSNNRFGICELCGYEPFKNCLQVHHKTYVRVGKEHLDDLILLCPYCHKKAHNK